MCVTASAASNLRHCRCPPDVELVFVIAGRQSGSVPREAHLVKAEAGRTEVEYLTRPAISKSLTASLAVEPIARRWLSGENVRNYRASTLPPRLPRGSALAKGVVDRPDCSTRAMFPWAENLMQSRVGAVDAERSIPPSFACVPHFDRRGRAVLN